MRSSKMGLWILLIKLGPKTLPIFAKLGEALWNIFKSSMGIKAAGIAGSVGLYTYLLTWEMGISLVVFLLVHEYGHMWAMKRCGMKTRGMYLIPGFGAVAIPNDKWGSARNEAFVAIMGPMFGLVGFVLPMYVVYRVTGEPLWAAVGAFMAFINLINLLPVNPLDGGRILKAVSYSQRLGMSLLTTITISLVTAILGLLAGFGLLFVMAFIGLIEIATEFDIYDELRAFFKTLARTIVGVVLVVCTLGLYFGIPFLLGYATMQEELKYPGFVDFSWFEAGLCGMFCVAGVIAAVWDVRNSTLDTIKPLYAYPLIALKDAWSGLKEVASIRSHHLKPIESYTRMSGRGRTLYGTSYLVLSAVHVFLIIILASVPGAELAKELLQ